MAVSVTSASDETAAPAADTGECSPRRGRPRSAGVDEALLAATLELTGEHGIDGMSMDDLAQRVGVSKATIYRRWPSKEALVLDALRHAMRPFDRVDTGTLRGDLVEFLIELGDRMSNGRTSDVLPHLLGVAVRDQALRGSLDEYVSHRRQPMRLIIERGVARDELAATIDIEVLIDALIGPFAYRRLFSRDPLDETFVEKLLAIVLPDI